MLFTLNVKLGFWHVWPFSLPRTSAYFSCSFIPKKCKEYCVEGNVFRCSALFWGTSWCMVFTSLCGFFVFEELETHRWETIIVSEGFHLNNQVIFAFRTLFNIYLLIDWLICHYVGTSKHYRVVGLTSASIKMFIIMLSCLWSLLWDNDLRVCC